MTNRSVPTGLIPNQLVFLVPIKTGDKCRPIKYNIDWFVRSQASALFQYSFALDCSGERAMRCANVHARARIFSCLLNLMPRRNQGLHHLTLIKRAGPASRILAIIQSSFCTATHAQLFLLVVVVVIRHNCVCLWPSLLLVRLHFLNGPRVKRAKSNCLFKL